MSDSQRTRLLALTFLCGVTEAVVVLAVAVVAFTPVSVGDSYWADFFRGFVTLGLAIPFLLPIAAQAVAKPLQARLASRPHDAASTSP